MASCDLCNTKLSFLAFGSTRCPTCTARMDQAKTYYLNQMDNAFHDKGVTPELERQIMQAIQDMRMPPDISTPLVDRLHYLRGLANIARMEQAKTHYLSQMDKEFHGKGVTLELERQIMHAINDLRMPPDVSTPIVNRLHYLRRLTEIRWGNVPVIQTNIHLDSDEMAHFDIVATYYKQNKIPKPLPGRIIGTNKKLYFLSSSGSGSAKIAWNNVLLTEPSTLQLPVKQGNMVTYQSLYGLRIQVSSGSGGGMYHVPDTLYAKTLIDTLVRLWKRQLVIYQETKTHGPVPDHVKAAVFQRDNGRCVQCGYSGEYIEYDHKIPRSKGGPNTVQNIQLLCRKCNLAKGDKL